jgi:hypothetical protein
MTSPCFYQASPPRPRTFVRSWETCVPGAFGNHAPSLIPTRPGEEADRLFGSRPSWPVLPCCPREREETSYPRSRKYKALAVFMRLTPVSPVPPPP